MATKPLGKFEFGLLTFVAQHECIKVRTIHERFGKPLGYILRAIDKGIVRLLSKGLVERVNQWHELKVQPRVKQKVEPTPGWLKGL